MSPEKMNKNLPSHPQSYCMEARAAGETAFLELTRRQSGQVFGVTSRGIFIRTEQSGLIFLSFEEFRGPLTVNLAEPFTPFHELQNGQRASLGENRLQIPAGHIEVLAAPEAVWRIPPADLTHISALRTRLESGFNLARMVNVDKKNAGLGVLIQALLVNPGELDADLPLWSEALRLRQALQERDVTAALASLSAFLGCGRGLTPSGDDFAIGVLLALNRWGFSLWEDAWRSNLNEKVILAARQKTTTLSAGLIDCAATGQADERLIGALDYLYTGQGDTAGLAAAISGWGSSSGIDALAGMTVVVLSSAQ